MSAVAAALASASLAAPCILLKLRRFCHSSSINSYGFTVLYSLIPRL